MSTTSTLAAGPATNPAELAAGRVDILPEDTDARRHQRTGQENTRAGIDRAVEATSQGQSAGWSHAGEPLRRASSPGVQRNGAPLPPSPIQGASAEHRANGQQGAKPAGGAAKPLPMGAPRARLTDPDTSVAAGDAAGEFVHEHHAVILGVLREFGPLTIHEIAMFCPLTATQIARRMPEMERQAEPTGEERKSPWGRSCRVWRAI